MEQKEEIAFFPSPVKRTRTLSQAQVTEFNELGYISPLDALTPAETTANRTYFDNLLAQVQAFDDGLPKLLQGHMGFGSTSGHSRLR